MTSEDVGHPAGATTVARPDTGRRPTLKRVAELAGVSPSTVSLVMQNKGNLPDATRERVRAAAERAGYRPAAMRRNEASGTTTPTGVIVDDLQNPYFAELHDAVDIALAPSGRLPLLVSSRGSVQRQVGLLRDLVGMGCAGALLIPTAGSGQETLDAIRRLRMPVVLGVRHLGFGTFDYVGPNYFSGMQLATNHLLALGHRRIAFVGGIDGNQAYLDRLAGLRIAISRADGEPVEVLEIGGPPTSEFGLKAMADLLALRDPPTAVIGYNDQLAFGLMAGAREAGLAVGRDISIVGFDDLRASALRTVPLTTVSTPPSRIGEEMARLLEARINNPDAEPVNIIPPPVLKVRKTCGPAPGFRGRGSD